MSKQLFISTALVAALSLNAGAYAADAAKTEAAATTQEAKKEVKKAVAKKHVKKAAAKKEDAYSAKHAHHKAAAAQPVEIVKETDVILVATPAAAKSEAKSEAKPAINADGVSVMVGGDVDVQYGVVNQEDAFKNLVIANLAAETINEDELNDEIANAVSEDFVNQRGIATSGKLKFRAEKAECEDMKYGAYVEIAPLTLGVKGETISPVYLKEANIYAQSKAGKLVLGAHNGPSEEMAISGASVAVATGGVDGDWSGWVASGAATTAGQNLTNAFITGPSLPYAGENSKKSSGVTYYTPVMNGFQAGIGYVADTITTGDAKQVLTARTGLGYKDVIEGGASYEYKKDKMSFKVSATAQTGSARPYVGATSSTNDALNFAIKTERERLAAWQVGAKAEFSGFAVAANYGDWGKSGLAKDRPTDAKTKQQFWSAGAAYKHEDKAGVSFTYMGSNSQGRFTTDTASYIYGGSTIASPIPNQGQAYYLADNKLQAFSVGAEYKIRNGFVPYVEATNFKFTSPLDATGAGVTPTNGTAVHNLNVNKGWVFMGGVKISF